MIPGVLVNTSKLELIQRPNVTSCLTINIFATDDLSVCFCVLETNFKDILDAVWMCGQRYPMFGDPFFRD